MLALTGPLLAGPSTGQSLRLSAPWSEHMVWQQKLPLNLRGQARPGSIVRAQVQGNSATAVAAENGSWQLSLPALPAGGPYRLELTAGDERLVLNDLLCGEVWLASGQSNMEWPLASATGPSVDEAKNPHPQLRLLSIPRKVGAAGNAYAEAAWQPSTTATQAGFSAVAFHFGLELQKSLGVPVGLIAAPWSGTAAETWTPLEALRADGAQAPVLSRWFSRSDAEKQMYSDGWSFWLEFRKIRLWAADGSSQDLDPSDWSAASAEGGRATVGRGFYRGLLPPGAWAAASGALAAEGASVDWSQAVAISFEAKGNSTFDLALAQTDIVDGDQPCSAAFTVKASWQKFRIELASLKQQGWGQPRPRDLGRLKALKFRVHAPNQFPDQPGLLFDAMLRPLAGYGLRGALWYQGESNTERAQEYGPLLKTLVQGWRQVLGPDLAFLVVQLPEFATAADAKPGTWAELRAAQAMALDWPNTGLATALGLGDLKDVHPRLKQPVGQRLAWEALGKVYGQKGKSGHGPRLSKAQWSNGKIRLAFEKTGHALKAGPQGLQGFECAGAEGVFGKSTATFHGDEVWVDPPKGMRPRAVRYAWADAPALGLQDAKGLPALPFSQSLEP